MKAVVLLSGGQDSTTSLYWAIRKWPYEVAALSLFYGQRHRAELEAAKQIAVLAGVRHDQFELRFLAELGDSDLVKDGTEIRAAGGRGDAQAPSGLPTSFVPGRNLLFLSTAAAYAVKLGAKNIVTGVCQTDYSGYPDCRRLFVDAFELAASLAMPSSAGPLEVHTPMMNLSKADTVRLARELPGCWEALALSLTCYQGTRCGACPACQLRAKGFEEAGEQDPAAL